MACKILLSDSAPICRGCGEANKTFPTEERQSWLEEQIQVYGLIDTGLQSLQRAITCTCTPLRSIHAADELALHSTRRRTNMCSRHPRNTCQNTPAEDKVWNNLVVELGLHDRVDEARWAG
jgi:hypothetical protein